MEMDAWLNLQDQSGERHGSGHAPIFHSGDLEFRITPISGSD